MISYVFVCRSLRLGSDIDTHTFVHLQPHRLLQLSDDGTTQEVNKLQHVMNAAAHVLTQMKKYNSRLFRILCDKLHWLNVSERVQFKLCIMAARVCMAQRQNLGQPVSTIEVVVACIQQREDNLIYHTKTVMSVYGRRDFSYGPSA